MDNEYIDEIEKVWQLSYGTLCSSYFSYYMQKMFIKLNILKLFNIYKYYYILKKSLKKEKNIIYSNKKEVFDLILLNTFSMTQREQSLASYSKLILIDMTSIHNNHHFNIDLTNIISL